MNFIGGDAGGRWLDIFDIYGNWLIYIYNLKQKRKVERRWQTWRSQPRPNLTRLLPPLLVARPWSSTSPPPGARPARGLAQSLSQRSLSIPSSSSGRSMSMLTLRQPKPHKSSACPPSRSTKMVPKLRKWRAPVTQASSIFWIEPRHERTKCVRFAPTAQKVEEEYANIAVCE